MKKEGVVINKKEHPDIYNWLSENVYGYKKNERRQQGFTLTSDKKINAYCYVELVDNVQEIKYPFGYVKYGFSCIYCDKIVSLIGFPKEVRGYFVCDACEKITSLIGLPKHINGKIFFRDNIFSNVPTKKEKYKLYLAMWLELFESVSNEERKEYITNYKDKRDLDYYILPIEILKEYGF